MVSHMESCYHMSLEQAQLMCVEKIKKIMADYNRIREN